MSFLTGAGLFWLRGNQKQKVQGVLSVKTLALKLRFQVRNNSLPSGIKGVFCVS